MSRPNFDISVLLDALIEPLEGPNSAVYDDKYINFLYGDNKFIKLMKVLCSNQVSASVMFIYELGVRMRFCDDR